MNLRPCVVEVVQQVPDVDVAIVAARVAERLSMPSERVRKLIERRTGPITKALRPDKAEAIAQTFQAAGVRVIVRAAEPDEIDPPPAPVVNEAVATEPAPAEAEGAAPDPSAEQGEEQGGEAVAEPGAGWGSDEAADDAAEEAAPGQPTLATEPPSTLEDGSEPVGEERGRPVARLRVEFEPPRVAELQPALPEIRPVVDAVGQPGWTEGDDPAYGDPAPTAGVGEQLSEDSEDAAPPAWAQAETAPVASGPIADHQPGELPPAIVVDDEPAAVSAAVADDFVRGRGWDSEVPLSWDSGSLRDDQRRLHVVADEDEPEVADDGAADASPYGRAGRAGGSDEANGNRVPTAWRGLAGAERGPARPEGARLPRRMEAGYLEEERVQRRRGVMLLLLFVAIVGFVFTQWWVASRASATTSSQAGMHAFHDGDFSAARRLWMAQAAAGDATAQFMLGYLAEAGLGADWSARTAAAWYMQAATSGHAEAAWRLGRLYQEGLGVVPDLAEARRWFRSAAEAGHGEAAFSWATVLLQEVMGQAAYTDAAAVRALSSVPLTSAQLAEVVGAFRLSAASGWHEAAPYAIAFAGWQTAEAQAGRP